MSDQNPPDIKQIGRYRIERLLGSGTFANVYLAVDTQLQREVALKVLKTTYSGDAEIYSRFKVEALSAANLLHPNIAWVWDLGAEGGYCYLTIRYIAGLSLDKLIREKGRLPCGQALGYAMDTGEALAYAHARSMIHRDVKPQNILISPTDGAVLTDFGLVKAMAHSGLQTRAGGVVGTPQYVPAEIWNGDPPTAAVDQYALGCVLFEMLTGRILYQASSLEAIVTKHFSGPAHNWYPLPPETPSGLEKVVRKALQPKPSERFASVTELVQALQVFKELAERSQKSTGEEMLTRIAFSNRPATPPEPLKQPFGTGSQPPPGKTPSERNHSVNIFSPKRSSGPVQRKLVLGSGPTAKTVRIVKKETTLGRMEDNDVKFADPEVSRHHARLVEVNDRIVVENLSNSNGTYVNQVRINGRVEIKNGDRIRLGKTVEMIYSEE